jgi:hypothetical protein
VLALACASEGERERERQIRGEIDGKRRGLERGAYSKI